MLDNYDSFTYNLVQELAEICDTEIRVVRNDALAVDRRSQVGQKRPSICLSKRSGYSPVANCS